MAYDRAVKRRILKRVKKGEPISLISQESGISERTIRNWAKDKSKIGIREQIATLSKLKPTESVSKKIAMLSKSLERMERMEMRAGRKRKVKSKPLLDLSSNEDYLALKQKALEVGGLYLYQREFLEDESQFRLVLKSRQIGFSYVSGLDALLGATAGRNQLFLSASEEQAAILMRYVEMWAAKLGVVFSGDSATEKRLANGSIIKVLANNFRTAQGFTGDIWMDEFAWYQNPKKMWHAFVPSIGAIKGRLTILSTPFEEQSLFYDLCTDTQRYFMFSRHTIDIYRAMRDGLEFDLETMRALFDADTWASAYECQFIDDESALLPISLIKSCVKDYTPRMPASNTDIASGYDVGRVKDRSVHVGIFNHITNKKETKRLCNLDVFTKATFDEQEKSLGRYLTSYKNARLKIDKTGIGMATAERLRSQYGGRVEGVYFTAPTKESLALNLKKHLEDCSIELPNDPMLIADLHAIKRKAGAKSFLYDADRNKHGHADRFWALALALSYFEVVRQTGGKAWIF